VNIVVHRSNQRLQADLEHVIDHHVELVIASVGSPAAIVEPPHAAGSLVFADVATLRHVDRALAAGVDGLVLLAAGAGGQTGWLNPLALLRAVRGRYDGPVVLAGGIADVAAMRTSLIAEPEHRARGTRRQWNRPFGFEHRRLLDHRTPRIPLVCSARATAS
jgi:nitronate monooxygenase